VEDGYRKASGEDAKGFSRVKPFLIYGGRPACEEAAVLVRGRSGVISVVNHKKRDGRFSPHRQPIHRANDILHYRLTRQNMSFKVYSRAAPSTDPESPSEMRGFRLRSWISELIREFFRSVRENQSPRAKLHRRAGSDADILTEINSR
jgi:hypothetical protein